MVWPKHVDRSYLPFDSARCFQDRGMAKWMGFFLSEHTSSLVSERDRTPHPEKMPMGELTRLVGELYAQQEVAVWIFLEGGAIRRVVGVVYDLQGDLIRLRTNQGFCTLFLESLFSIQDTEKGERTKSVSPGHLDD